MQHCTWLSPPDTSTTGCHFCFGSASSFLLELFLHSSPVAYWTSTHLGGRGWGGSSFSVISFCLCKLFMGFSGQECWSGLSFPFPVDYILSKLSTMTCLSWVALHSMAHSFIKLHKAMIHVITLVSFLILVFILSALQASWWKGGKPGLALVAKAMLSKSLIQFPADRWGCALSP